MFSRDYFFLLNYFWAHRMLRKNPAVPQKSGHKTHIPMFLLNNSFGFFGSKNKNNLLGEGVKFLLHKN